MNYFFKDIQKYLGNYSVISGNTDLIFQFNNVKSIFEADELSLCWINPTRKDKYSLLSSTRASLIICGSEESFEELFEDKVFIKVQDPKLVYLRIVKGLFTTSRPSGIASSAIISPQAEVGNNVTIGPHAVIGECYIGDNTYVGSNCVIHDKCVIGSNVVIKAGAVIGGEGFGYAKNEFDEYEKFPHIGGVIIGDNVEIGSNTCIDRGALGNTVISDGAKIDNLVHIAHNVYLGRNCFVIANAMVAGSTKIGDNTWIAPSVSIRDAIDIGSDCVIGMASLVLKDVPNNEVWLGVPAKKK